MGRITVLRDLIGIIKDKASQSKAAIISKPKNQSLQLALLRATTHDTSTPPNPKHITALLCFGNGSRATASAAIEALMDRLQSTRDASVAIKCLVIVHHVIRQGTFILQDQLSVYPSSGGRNYLKLSNFRDDTSPTSWELSSWVRWYARYLEILLSTSRILGFFLCSTSSTAEKDEEEGKVTSLMNSDLLKELDSLVSIVEELCKKPEILHMHGHNIVDEIIGLVGEDYLSAINAISIRVDEFNHRVSCLSFSDSVELVCVFKRLEDCKEKLLTFSMRKKVLTEGLWCLTSEIKGKIEMDKSGGENGRLLLTMGSESARFGDRVLKHGDSVRFSSTRFGLNSGMDFFVV